VTEHAQEFGVTEHVQEFEVTRRLLREVNWDSIALVVAREWVLSVAQELPLEVNSDLIEMGAAIRGLEGRLYSLNAVSSSAALYRLHWPGCGNRISRQHLSLVGWDHCLAWLA